MCVPNSIREAEMWTKSHCHCCKGRKSPKRTSWHCAKCDRRIKSAVRKSVALWKGNRAAA